MESQDTEYKQSWHDEYPKWVCGFNIAKEYTSKPQQAGRLKRIGFDRSGYWRVINNSKN